MNEGDMMKRKNRSARRWLLPALTLAAALVLLIAAALVLLSRLVGYQMSQIVTRQGPLIQFIRPQESISYLPVVNVAIYLSDATYVELIVNQVPINSYYNFSSVQSGWGYTFTDVLLRPGKNVLEARVRAQRPINSSSWVTATRSITFELDPPSVPTLSALTFTTTNISRVVIEGSADPGAPITLTVNGTPNHVTLAESDGRFRTEVRLSEPHVYSITAQARNSRNHASRLSEPITFTYDPQWFVRPSAVSPLGMVARTITVTVGFNRVSYDIEVSLPSDDARGSDLLSGRENTKMFVDRMFGSLSVADSRASDRFAQVAPKFVISPTQLTVLASSNAGLSRVSGMPLTTGDVLVNYDLPNIEKSRDTIVVVLDNYQLEALNPMPTSYVQNVAIWTGVKGRAVQRSTISVRVTNNLLRNPFALFTLSPDDLVPYPISSLLHLVEGLLRVLPLLLLWWLFKQEKQSGWANEPLSVFMRRLSYRLIVLNFIGPTIYVILSSQLLATLGHRPYVGLVVGALLLGNGPYVGLVVGALVLLWLSLKNRLLVSGMVALGSGVAAGAAILGIEIVRRAAPELRDWLEFAYVLLMRGIGLLYLLILCAWIRKLLSLSLGHAFGRWRGWLVGAVVLAMVVPIYASSGTIVEIYQLTVIQILFRVRNFLPFVLALAVVLLLRRLDDKSPQIQRVRVQLGRLLFAGFLVGSTANLFLIPLPFLLALWLFKRLVLMDETEQTAVEMITPLIYEKRSGWTNVALMSVFKARQFRDALNRLEKKIATGDLLPSDYAKRRTEIETYLEESEKQDTLVNGKRARDMVLGIGPCETHWQNAIGAARRGLLLAMPLLVVYAGLVFSRESQIGYWWDNFESVVSPIFQVLRSVLDWLVAAFFFGYYFAYIRGGSGLEKGIRLSLAIVLCLLPSWLENLSTAADAWAIIIRASQIILFYTLLGLWAFDYVNFRQSLRERFEWRKFASFGGLAKLMTLGSVLVASLGVPVTSVLTGQFKTIVESLIKNALPQIPQILK